MPCKKIIYLYLMEMIVHDPTENIYPTDGDWVHAMEVRDARRMLFISGTMGLDPAGVPGANLEEQLNLVWNNIRAILASAGMTTGNIVRVASYLREAGYAEANARARCQALGERRVPTTAIVVQTLDSSWLVEIEVVAAG
jgi:enamine deaminase RidA (YjgF/YER057c/UK114 family)